MSNFPNNFDDDTTLPAVNDNITEAGGDAINALRDAVLAIQLYLGLNGAGTTNSIAARLGVSIQPDGTLKPSAITSLGLVTLPITQDQIANHANIPESKLHLDHRTQDLFNYIRDLSADVNLALGWISTSGVKLEPHLLGVIYRHTMDQIDVSNDEDQFLSNNLRTLRDNLNSYTLVKDINNELLAHQWADGSPFGTQHTITTNNGSVYSSYYAHTASGIFINTSRFNNIPQTADDVQLFAEYIDSSSIFLLGTRIQNLYTAGISRVSRSSNLTEDGYGQSIVPPTPAIAFLKNIGNSSSPYDNIDTGDDIIEFKPTAGEQTSNRFDAKFALVKVGDIVRINYGNIEVPYLIKEKKYSGTSGSKKYIVRIAGKNQFYTTTAIARIDKPLANNNKFGELSISPVNNSFSATPSLIINNPRGAQATGIGFNPDQFDEKHYLLYLALYPTGFAQDGYTILPAIDVTGNRGTTPGAYTLESIVQATNNAFRAVGFNYRFTAFSYQGEFGICLSESYNNAAFSILSTAMKTDGSIDAAATSIAFPANVVDLQPLVGTIGSDPLGFGPTGSGIASPPFYSSYGTPSNSTASQFPTKLLIPLRRNSYYVDGAEKERLNREPTQALDGYGDGYWVGTIQDVTIPAGRVQTTYRIPLDLSTSGLKAGKTIVVQSLGAGTLSDFGRFIIQNVVFGCSPTNFTDITVYDSVHAVGASPSPVLQPFSQVAIYFGADSVSFNTESATDFTVVTPFKKHFEVYVDFDGNTFTHERARINISGSTQTVNSVPLYGTSELSKLDIIKVSPKLRGFQFGTVNKITLRIFSYSSSSGVFDGYLSSWDGTNYNHYGPRTTGKKGAVTRFYDETNTDYIDVLFDVNATVSDLTDQVIDFQLFPSLALDDHLMLLGTCQVNDTTGTVSRILDSRQFGNTSEKDLSTSVFDYMSIPERHLHTNGVVRGFDVYQSYNGASANIYLTGGIALVNGKFLNINNDTVTIPAVRELFQSAFYDITWAICVNDIGELKIIPTLDSPSGYPNEDRLFVGADVVSATSYNMNAYTLSDIFNKVSSLTPLYLVNSVVTGTTSPIVNITITDARRYVRKKDWGQTPTLTTGVDLGEFRSWASLGTWLNTNETFDAAVNLKGNFTSGVPATLAYNSGNTKVKFLGNSNTSLALGSTATITNVDLSDMTVTVPTSGVTLNTTNSNWEKITLSGKVNTWNFNTANLRNSTFTNTRDISGVSILQFNNSVIENVTFNMQGVAIAFFNCKVSNCTFISTTTGNSINTNSTLTDLMVFEKNNVGMSNTGTILSMAGNIRDNCFEWFNGNNTFFVNATATITGNLFYASNGISNLDSFITFFDGTSSLITNNRFIRGNNNLLSGYINVPVSWTSGIGEVSDNYFDSPTYNGSSQVLVANMPEGWIYRNNLNTPPTLTTKYIYNDYTVLPTDHVLMVVPNIPITITLPSLVNCPVGRTLIIKDASGSSGTNAITLKHFSNDLIENYNGDYVLQVPLASVTLVRGWTQIPLFGDFPNWHIL